MRLYRSKSNPTRWYAYSTETGWVMFPAEGNGWEKRQPARGLDPIDIREVPAVLAGNAGIPGASAMNPAASDLRLQEAA